jgi:hypothetical protein
VIQRIGSNAIINQNSYNLLIYADKIGIGTTNPYQIAGIVDIRQNMIIPNGKIGIGTTNPFSNLDIIGNMNIVGDLNISNLVIKGDVFRPDGTAVINSQWINALNFNSNIYYNLGNVGIGSTNPRFLIDVINDINCGKLFIGSNNPIDFNSNY